MGRWERLLVSCGVCSQCYSILPPVVQSSSPDGRMDCFPLYKPDVGIQRTREPDTKAR